MLMLLLGSIMAGVVIAVIMLSRKSSPAANTVIQVATASPSPVATSQPLAPTLAVQAVKALAAARPNAALILRGENPLTVISIDQPIPASGATLNMPAAQVWSAVFARGLKATFTNATTGQSVSVDNTLDGSVFRWDVMSGPGWVLKLTNT